LLGGYLHCGISRQLGKGKGLCEIDFAKNKCILSCTQIFLCKYKQGLAKNQKTSGDTDQPTDAASKLVCRLYDQKGKLKEDHVDLSKLGVRLATLRDACLAKLPPCEDTFTQHVLRSLLQINIWMTAYVAKPPMKSAVLLGWEDRNGLVPVYFKGQMSSDFLQDLKLFVLAKENLCA
jgi:hypothetical protein